MNTKLKPIPELDNLPDQKRDLLHDWIEHLGYRQTLEKLKSEWQVDVTYNKLFRYYHRHLKNSAVGALLEDKLSMSDFLAILNGEPVPYDQSGIELIMKRAFDLACAHDVNPSTLATLLRVFHYKTSRAWTERRLVQNDQRIQISDRLAKVREGELDLKKPDPTDEQDDQARAMKFTQRVAAAFSQHPALQAIKALNPSPDAEWSFDAHTPSPAPLSETSAEPSSAPVLTPHYPLIPRLIRALCPVHTNSGSDYDTSDFRSAWRPRSNRPKNHRSRCRPG